MNQSRNPYEQPNRSDAASGNGWGRKTEPGYGSLSNQNAGQPVRRSTYEGRPMLKGAAGRAEPSADDVLKSAERRIDRLHSTNRDDIAAILDEVEQKRHTNTHSQPRVEYSPHSSEVSAHANARREEAVHHNVRPKAAAGPTERRNPRAYTMPADHTGPEEMSPQLKKNTKKKSKVSFTDVLKNVIPWKGDTPFEAVRKIVFSTALVVVGVCTFLISSYYIDRYKAKKEYAELEKLYEDSMKNRSFQNEHQDTEVQMGQEFEYLEYNEFADWLKINPDFVGHINIPGTVVSYPVVQKKSQDIKVNTNDYYLDRTFKQEMSKSGCIFMDYRCHFDEAIDHRRVYDNSGNIFVYGHNMNNRTMFGSLRDYINNPYFYSEHPIVEFSSVYNHYKYKIFAIFIVDGEDYTSKYAFDCWNTLEFPTEEVFYDYVNEAKKRTLVCNDVDVKYGDPILSLYTCNGLVKDAKLIIMCRQVRAGEDLYEGTKNATLNENVLYPTAYYNAGNPENYDPSKFVPYGPKS